MTPLATLDISTQVFAVLTKQLRLGKASMAGVAQSLSVSEATLRRRLLQEGTSFSKLLDQVRFELAKRYLGDPTLQPVDTAHLLGFPDTKGFSEAFTRWTDGVTPDVYRASKLHQ